MGHVAPVVSIPAASISPRSRSNSGTPRLHFSADRPSARIGNRSNFEHPYGFGERRFAPLALLTLIGAFRTAFLRGYYRQILKPRRHFAKFADGFCQHGDALIYLNPHRSRQATKSYLERGNASGSLSHVGFPPIGLPDR